VLTQEDNGSHEVRVLEERIRDQQYSRTRCNHILNYSFLQDYKI